jgi:hypothetical protein
MAHRDDTEAVSGKGRDAADSHEFVLRRAAEDRKRLPG